MKQDVIKKEFDRQEEMKRMVREAMAQVDPDDLRSAIAKLVYAGWEARQKRKQKEQKEGKETR